MTENDRKIISEMTALMGQILQTFLSSLPVMVKSILEAKHEFDLKRDETKIKVRLELEELSHEKRMEKQHEIMKKFSKSFKKGEGACFIDLSETFGNEKTKTRCPCFDGDSPDPDCKTCKGEGFI